VASVAGPRRAWIDGFTKAAVLIVNVRRIRKANAMVLTDAARNGSTCEAPIARRRTSDSRSNLMGPSASQAARHV
jgi:hypothetical protein